MKEALKILEDLKDPDISPEELSRLTGHSVEDINTFFLEYNNYRKFSDKIHVNIKSYRADGSIAVGPMARYDNTVSNKVVLFINRQFANKETINSFFIHLLVNKKISYGYKENDDDTIGGMGRMTWIDEKENYVPFYYKDNLDKLFEILSSHFEYTIIKKGNNFSITLSSFFKQSPIKININKESNYLAHAIIGAIIESYGGEELIQNSFDIKKNKVIFKINKNQDNK